MAVPECKSCGATPEQGLAIPNGKPKGWYRRTIDGVTEFACSRACIPDRESVLPW